LNLSFTRVESPITGRISRTYYTRGNLVTQDQTLLTTIVSVDPMYVYFDVEERTYDQLVKVATGGKHLPLPRQMTGFAALAGGPGWQGNVIIRQTTNVPVYMALEGEDGYPHQGRLNFINNQVNPSTGTIAVRGTFHNTRGAGNLWALLPGRFVRVRLPLGTAHPGRLVIDRAISSDQGLKYVYVVDAENKAQYRRVKTGALQEDGLRVIEEGLTPEDRVVVGGLQQLRPRMEVKPDLTPMPTLTSGSDSASRRKAQPPVPGEKPTGEKPAGGKKK
jgi:multidrug efflux system membrane fusion protein